MKILNLVNQDLSDIKYKISRFPDGQQQVVILDKNPNKTGYKTENFISGTNKKYLIIDHIVPVTIKSRLNNFLDLELIICAVASLRELGVEEIHLYTPYFMGARSDRKFEEGGNWYLRDVICPIINSLGFKYVTVLDPHSSVLGNLIKGFRSVDNKQLVGFALKEIYGLPIDPVANINKCILVSPDAGASHKIYKLAEQIGYKGDIITCSKERDAEGKLTQVQVPEYHQPNKDLIIIDDICDGGRTFINIAKHLKEYKHHKGKIYLIVTHGIFSNGFEELSKYFDGIYCTNSYKDIPKDYEFGTGSGIFLPDLVNQLNVF